ncbi:MAG TPA: hypothetical protein VIL37_16830 [Natronosporangium sp.]
MEQRPAYGVGPAAYGDEPPANVAQLAHQRQLGPRLASRYLANPFAVAGFYLVLALACLGLLALGSTVFEDTDGILGAVIRFAVLFLCFGFVGTLTASIAVLVRGAQSFHVYAGGFIHRRNSRLQVWTWPELAELAPVIGKRGDQSGKLLSYQLVPRQGKPVPVPLVIEDGRDQFMDRLIGALQQAGVPVR